MKINSSDWSLYKVKYEIGYYDTPVEKGSYLVIGIEIIDVLADTKRYFNEVRHEDNDFIWAEVKSIKCIGESLNITEEAQQTATAKHPA